MNKYIVINCAEEGDSYYIAQYALTDKGIAIFQLCYEIEGMNINDAVIKAQKMTHREGRRAAAVSALSNFNQHLEDCVECHVGVLKNLCDVGCELLLEAADEVSADWHPVIHMLHEQDRLEREDANTEVI